MKIHLKISIFQIYSAIKRFVKSRLVLKDTTSLKEGIKMKIYINSMNMSLILLFLINVVSDVALGACWRKLQTK